MNEWQALRARMAHCKGINWKWELGRMKGWRRPTERGSAGTGALHGERYEEEADREREGWRMEERSRENVSGHCCIAASLLMRRLPLHTPSPSLRSSLAPPSLSWHWWPTFLASSRYAPLILHGWCWKRAQVSLYTLLGSNLEPGNINETYLNRFWWHVLNWIMLGQFLETFNVLKRQFVFQHKT